MVIERINFLKSIVEKVPFIIKSIQIVNSDTNIIEIDKKFLIFFVLFLKKHTPLQFSLIDITCVDIPSRMPRFEIIYQFLSFLFNQRITLKIKSESTDSVPSLSLFFKSANWLEREVWDMFGIFFSNHLDLRRILTDYGFQGFPLRKDFPLSGFVELIYSDETKKVLYVPIELTQEYRFFDFLTSW